MCRWCGPRATRCPAPRRATQLTALLPGTRATGLCDVAQWVNNVRAGFSCPNNAHLTFMGKAFAPPCQSMCYNILNAEGCGFASALLVGSESQKQYCELLPTGVRRPPGRGRVGGPMYAWTVETDRWPPDSPLHVVARAAELHQPGGCAAPAGGAGRPGGGGRRAGAGAVSASARARERRRPACRARPPFELSVSCARVTLCTFPITKAQAVQGMGVTARGRPAGASPGRRPAPPQSRPCG